MNLNTRQLEPNMILAMHGGMFRLGKCIFDDGEVKTFETEYLGLEDGATYCSVPKHWLKDWTVQGNSFAFWKVIP